MNKFVGTLCLTFCGLLFAAPHLGTVFLRGSSFEAREGVSDPHGVAYGFFDNTLKMKGFGTFVVKTNGQYDDEKQAYAAGYLEGVLQHDGITAMYNTISQGWKDGNPFQETLDFMNSQVQFIKNNANSTNPKFSNMMVLYKQIEGMCDGYNWKANKKLSFLEFMAFTVIDGVYLNIFMGIQHHPTTQAVLAEKAAAGLNLFNMGNDHCTSLVKLLPDYSDLFFGHNLWYSYASLSLQYKEYHFSFKNPSIKAQKLYSVGWPGVIDSSVHWVINDKNIAVVETSLDVAQYNYTLPHLNNQTIPSTLMVVLALRMSSTAKDFVEIFSKDNANTFMSQWTILDMNKFTPGQAPPSETLYFLENVPGVVHYEDVSTNLTTSGYVGSYNVILWDDVKEKMGQTPEFENGLGPNKFLVQYWDCPRGKIFERDQSKVTNLQTFKDALRYDDWQNDPISQGHAKWVTAARGDLVNMTRYPDTSFGSRCSGCLDGKVLSVKDWKAKKQFHFIASPPYKNNPAFKFSTSPCSVLHNNLMPDEWRFDWYAMNANIPIPMSDALKLGSFSALLLITLAVLFI